MLKEVGDNTWQFSVWQPRMYSQYGMFQPSQQGMMLYETKNSNHVNILSLLLLNLQHETAGAYEASAPILHKIASLF